MRTVRPRTRPLTRRRTVAVAGVSAALVLGVTATALAATGSTSSGSTSRPTAAASTPAPTAGTGTAHPRACSPGVGPLLAGTPGALRTDLRKLHHATTGQDEDVARAAVRAHALAGDYGTRDKALAGALTGKAVAKLPAALKSDLKALKALPRGSSERAAKRADVWTSALGGEYGTTVQKRATAAHDRLQARCVGTSPSPSPSSTAS